MRGCAPPIVCAFQCERTPTFEFGNFGQGRRFLRIAANCSHPSRIAMESFAGSFEERVHKTLTPNNVIHFKQIVNISRRYQLRNVTAKVVCRTTGRIRRREVNGISTVDGHDDDGRRVFVLADSEIPRSNGTGKYARVRWNSGKSAIVVGDACKISVRTTPE